ncbi:TetR family transcriptional regulator [Sediminihabitans luteus]|uniref:TetR family transcriptional regulator n=1 Tax=Sediminihabitans luteus TaxID=1138585 RepID=A0A2M9CZM7_9CELL|nr:TetR/AcrR family transcriptional regulator [Sediminihabitans luteus]PJJ77360.1 TetR family transcriptional regulator [Sediminihabitans luteus]
MSSSPPGRPQDPAITDALLRVGERVMRTDGYSRLTVESLCSEIGTTRPAFYRRFPNVAHLAFAVIASRYGNEPTPDTGSLAGDVLELQRGEVLMFADPLLHKNLPGILESVRTDPDVARLYGEGFMGPRRVRVVRVVDRAVARGEIGPPHDLPFVCDVLVGPILTRALLPGPGGLDEDLARSTADAALALLRRGRADSFS